MALHRGYRALTGSEHALPKDHKDLGASRKDAEITSTFILRRRKQAPKLRKLDDYSNRIFASGRRLSHAEFAGKYGADPKEIEKVSAFARSHGLQVVEKHPGRRSIVVRGTVAAINRAFAVEMHDYQSKHHGKYRSHTGAPALPRDIAPMVEAILGLHGRPVPAQRYSTGRSRNPNDPPDTHPLTPQQVASLYNFPAGDGNGETIGIYEMQTREGAAGYTMQDIVDTMRAFDGPVPKPIDVAIDGIGNSGVSDGETGLDITIASAIAPRAKIAVYFTGATPQHIIHALQRMIHPGPKDPRPTILSISYGWGPDDIDQFSDQDYEQIGKLFQDAANLSITVLVSSGDSGAFIASPKQAQTSYPATEPWVIACGGTTIGDRKGARFEEYVWNDTGRAGRGGTGGGISARFPVPSYQKGIGLPKRIGSRKPGRGIPDIAGNASENSGYTQFISGRSQPVGGTSAVAPLYAGLIARINANLGRSVGFINPILYGLPKTTFRAVAGPPGPSNNSFQGVKGYPASVGWNACTGLGSLDGTALQQALQTIRKGRKPRPQRISLPRRLKRFKTRATPTGKVFAERDFAGVPVTDAFAQAALQETPVVHTLKSIPWPANLKPTVVPLGNYKPGEQITGPVKAKVDALVLLYTDHETQALLDVFTGDNSWTPARKKTWCGYAHNFAKFRSKISDIKANNALKAGLFGYLSAVKVGAKTVALYKSELHPKQDGKYLPFVPVVGQLIEELAPSLVISTGTAGAIGGKINCGDVVITSTARFKCRVQYPDEPDIDTMSTKETALSNSVPIPMKYINYAASNLTKLSLPGLAQCHSKLLKKSGYSFVKKNTKPPAIYVTNQKPVPGSEPMAIVSADYLTVDDNHNSEHLQTLGVMNDTDDAFAFYAISRLAGKKPSWLSIRNASEPQVVTKSFAPSTPMTTIIKDLKGIAGRIYGIYQYCTTLNSAFACWGVLAGL